MPLRRVDRRSFHSAVRLPRRPDPRTIALGAIGAGLILQALSLSCGPNPASSAAFASADPSLPPEIAHSPKVAHSPKIAQSLTAPTDGTGAAHGASGGEEPSAGTDPGPRPRASASADPASAAPLFGPPLVPVPVGFLPGPPVAATPAPQPSTAGVDEAQNSDANRPPPEAIRPAPPPREPFVGVWGPHASACSRRASPYLPVVLKAGGARAGDAACSFRERRQEAGNRWSIVARCSHAREAWTAHVKLALEGDKLTWTSERGFQAYVRCPASAA